MTEAQILKQNEGLIYKFAMRFIRRYPELADDILQAAKIGFLMAIRQHDPAKGTINTLAGFIVVREIADMLDADRLVRIPNHKATAMRQALRKFAAGETLTAKERMAATLGLQPASLNTKIFAEDQEAAIDLLVSPEPGPDELVERADTAARVRAVLETLSPERAEVVRMRFFSEMTFEAIGEARGKGGKAGAAELYGKALRQLKPQLAGCV